MFAAVEINGIKFSNIHMVYDANTSGIATLQATREHLLSRGFSVQFADKLKSMYLERLAE